MLTIHKLVQSALEDFKEGLKQEKWVTEDYVSDLIHEIADTNVPIYNDELLEVALSNLWLACSESELWPAFWKATPVNLLMSNIYEYIRDELFDRYTESKIEE